jgi:hypothetical protein
VPLVVERHAGVDQRDAGDLSGICGGPRQREEPAEVMGDQVHPADAELLDQPAQMRGVGGHGVVVICVFVCVAEAGHIRCDDRGEFGDVFHQRFPVDARVRVAVHKNDGLGGRPDAADQHRRVDAVDHQVAGLESVHSCISFPR